MNISFKAYGLISPWIGNEPFDVVSHLSSPSSLLIARSNTLLAQLVKAIALDRSA